MRVCSNVLCKNTNPQPITNFQKSSRTKHGCQSRCKDCRNGDARANPDTVLRAVSWAKRNPAKFRQYERNSRIKSIYGITTKDYNEMDEKQKGFCLVCLTHKSTSGKPLVIDHCHKNGKVRGLLCGPCNSGMGFLKDSVELCISAAKYLKEQHIKEEEQLR